MDLNLTTDGLAFDVHYPATHVRSTRFAYNAADARRRICHCISHWGNVSNVRRATITVPAPILRPGIRLRRIHLPILPH